ncbi:MAG: type II secretion system F family protein [Phycisphaeraceae bacterium]|nr:type II secretion system F family protein [Phycisphaeraceae bacterium]
MPSFQYEALNESGKPQKGVVSAASSEDAISRIRSQGLFPTSVREQKVKKGKAGAPAGGAGGGGGGGGTPGKKKSFALGGIKPAQLTTFTRQFSTLQDAGLPILRSLQILEAQQKPGVLKNVLMDVTEDVSSGLTLADAMAKHPKAFNRLYTKMIAAGEVAGVLEMILQRLSDFLEKAIRLKRRIKGAMTYPAVVIFVAVVIVTALMLFIVPKFTGIFKDFDSKLPALTQHLIDASDFLGGKLISDKSTQAIPGVVWVVCFPIVFFIVIKLARRSQTGKAIFDRLVLYVPVLGNLVAKATVARFTRTLGTLIRAGVPILDALTITRDTTANYVFQKALTGVYESVRQGESFAEPLRKARVCDGIVTNMIDVGEETGDLDKMLLKIADNHDEEVDTLVDSMTRLIEPLMTLMLGGIVGFIVIALFMPLVSLIQSVSGGK